MKIAYAFKLIDIKTLALAFAIGLLIPLAFLQFTLWAFSSSGNTNLYLFGSALLYAVYFLIIPISIGYIASLKAKQLPKYHGIGATLLFAITAYTLSEPIYWWLGLIQLLTHTLLGVFGTHIAARRRNTQSL
ncbi:hypothetical protein [Pseudomonas leptonychotis]|uniref:hypothetical protein n=1 Tax=Pseudomonas leptonychotis TaxID=2448482 RepID=UPI0039EF9ED7